VPGEDYDFANCFVTQQTNILPLITVTGNSLTGRQKRNENEGKSSQWKPDKFPGLESQNCLGRSSTLKTRISLLFLVTYRRSLRDEVGYYRITGCG
jgi:hypothetical protein